MNGKLMTRPAVIYDTTIMAPNQYTWYSGAGNINGTFAASAAWERRFMSKVASVKTLPRRKGQYCEPTTYSCIWGIWKASTYATVEVAGPVAPSANKQCVYVGSPLSSLGYNPYTRYAVPSYVEGDLIRKALNKLRNNKVNFGVALGEAKETASLFSESLHRITKSVVDFRHKRPKDWLKVIGLQTGVPVSQRTKAKRLELRNAIPNSWLEVQYGWNPLMSDVSGACSELSSNLEFEPRRPVVVRSRKKILDTGLYSVVWSPGYAISDFEVDVKVDAKVQLCYTLNSFPTALFSSLGLTNPAEIVWELVPYSFVVDWFLPIGDWLSAMGGDFGYSFVNGSFSRFVRQTDRFIGARPAGSYANPLGGEASGHSGYFVRTVYSSSPWPGLSFKSPVSVGHIANALSLLTNIFKKH